MILILFFLLLLVSPVYSDSFNIAEDGALNEYYQATTFSISDLPSNNLNDTYSIEYDSDSVLGITTEILLQNHTISSLTSLWYMKRVLGVADRVSGPPGTSVDINYFFFNDTGHDIDISKIAIPFSRGNPNNGNLCNLIENTEVRSMNIDVSFDSRVIKKIGILKEYEGLGLITTDSMGAYHLDTLLISNPIVIDNMQFRVNEEEINIKIEIKNISTENLSNMIYEHNDFIFGFNLESMDIISIEYSLPYTEDLGYYKITNPNEREECAVYGSNNYNWFSPDAVTVLAYRNDGGWVNGSHLQPVGEGFCITRIPYSMIYTFPMYEKVEDDDILKEDGDELEEEKQSIKDREIVEILGVQNINNFILPKTAKRIY